MTILVV